MRVRVSLMSGAIWEGGELSGATYIHTPIYIYICRCVPWRDECM